MISIRSHVLLKLCSLISCLCVNITVNQCLTLSLSSVSLLCGFGFCCFRTWWWHRTIRFRSATVSLQRPIAVCSLLTHPTLWPASARWVWFVHLLQLLLVCFSKMICFNRTGLCKSVLSCYRWKEVVVVARPVSWFCANLWTMVAAEASLHQLPHVIMGKMFVLITGK